MTKRSPDVARVHHRQNIGMLELRGDPHLMKKLLMPGVVISLGDFECDFNFLNRVLRPIDVRERPRRYSTENFVFAKPLARF